MLKWVFNRNFLLPLAILLGFVAPRFSRFLAPFVIPILALAMTVAAVHIPNAVFADVKKLMAPALMGLLMTYGVLGSFLILAAMMGPFPEEISLGLILIGVAPPAVAVMPFTSALKGDLSFTLAGIVVSYLSALIVVPVAIWFLMGEGHYDLSRLISVLAWVVLLPVGISRLVFFLGWEKWVKAFDGPITNLSFFLVLYAIVGVNRGAFLTEPAVLVPLAVVVFLATFVLGEAVNLVAKALGMTRERRISATLMATLKNQGVAGGLALSLFESEAALPSAIYAVFMMLSFLWFSVRFRVPGETMASNR